MQLPAVKHIGPETDKLETADMPTLPAGSCWGEACCEGGDKTTADKEAFIKILVTCRLSKLTHRATTSIQRPVWLFEGKLKPLQSPAVHKRCLDI
jgi:hypothetical protein